VPDAPPEIELPSGADVVLDQAPLLSILPAVSGLGLPLNRREDLRADDPGVGPRLLHPPGGEADVIAVLERLGDQALQDIVVEDLPPRLIGERSGGLRRDLAAVLRGNGERRSLIARPDGAAGEGQKSERGER